MLIGDKVLIGNEEGDLHILSTGRQFILERKVNFRSAIYSTPVSANGVL